MNDKNKDIKEKEESKENFFLEFMKKVKTAETNEEIDKTVDKFFTSKSIRNITIFLVKGVNKLNYYLDSMLNSDKKIMGLSLVIAVGMYFMVNGGFAINSEYYAILNNVEVKIVGLNENYEVLNAPSSVVINIFGEYVDVQSAKLKKNYNAYIDVSNLKEGVNQNVPILANGISDKLGYDIKPETVEITIAKKVAKTFDLQFEFINEVEDSDYIIQDPTLEFDTVKLRAAEQNLDKVARVVALIDANIRESKSNQIAEIVAYDANDNVIDIEITPKEVTYDIEVSKKYSKVVDLIVEVAGNIDPNYGIKNITYLPKQIEIFGVENDIADITSYIVTYNVSSDLKETTQFSIPITEYPSGITKTSISVVEGTIEIEEIISKEITGIPITTINNVNNYQVSFTGGNSEVTIRVTGIKSKIDPFTSEDVEAYIDLNGVNVGSKNVNIELIISDISLNWEWVSNKEISIIIQK